MSLKDTTITIDGITISPYSLIRRVDQPNESSHRTLGGKLYTDFRNNLRSWEVTWNLLKEDEFQIIYDRYNAQYTGNRYAVVRFAFLNISIPAKIELNTMNIRYNAGFLEGFSIKIIEQNAIS